jgi:excisionase family DNA binding protein
MERLDRTLDGPAPRMLYTRREAAELLSLCVNTVDILISRGMLGSRKMGRKRLIPHAALAAFAQKNHTSIWPAKKNGKTMRAPEGGEVKTLTAREAS